MWVQLILSAMQNQKWMSCPKTFFSATVIARNKHKQKQWRQGDAVLRILRAPLHRFESSSLLLWCLYSQPLDVVLGFLPDELDALQDICDVINSSLLDFQDLSGPVQVQDAVGWLGNQTHKLLSQQAKGSVIACPLPGRLRSCRKQKPMQTCEDSWRGVAMKPALPALPCGSTICFSPLNKSDYFLCILVSVAFTICPTHNNCQHLPTAFYRNYLLHRCIQLASHWPLSLSLGVCRS